MKKDVIVKEKDFYFLYNQDACKDPKIKHDHIKKRICTDSSFLLGKTHHFMTDFDICSLNQIRKFNTEEEAFEYSKKMNIWILHK